MAQKLVSFPNVIYNSCGREGLVGLINSVIASLLLHQYVHSGLNESGSVETDQTVSSLTVLITVTPALVSLWRLFWGKVYSTSYIMFW